MAKEKIYDIAVVGGGAGGSMAAIRASSLGKRVVLAERNDRLGRKILMTGKGRCNITNTAPLDVFIKKFRPRGEFLRTAFFSFSNEEVMEFFRSEGLELKIERQGRVFPASDRAHSVVSVLEGSLEKNGVDIMYGARIVDIARTGGRFVLVSKNGARIEASKVILAAGGASYKATGSSGDGFKIAERLGHRIAFLKPALVPLKTKERWVKDLQGLALENVRITFRWGGEKLVSEIGEAIFTHFGISGPLVLDMSGDVVRALEKHKEVKMALDLKPALKKEQLEKRLVNLFAAKGNIGIRNLMHDLLPKKMIDVFLSLLDIIPQKAANQVTKVERRAVIDMLKAFPLTVTASLPLEEAMVTAGGISADGINPRTMESRLVPGLYFAGEMIEGAAPSGGYNLQQAFSTGYLAGENAASG